MNDKTYEMLWDCEYCGSRKLLGKTHRHCPECGGMQNPDKRYFPKEEEKVAVEDHEYVGADLRCGACAAPNSAKAKFCCDCGAPLGDAPQVDVVADTGGDHPVGKTEKPAGAGSSTSGSGKKKALWAVLGALILGVVALIGVGVFWTETVAITATGHSWKREIKVENLGPRRKSDWCDRKPADAYSVSRTRDVRSHRDVPDGETCTTKRVDNRDGTFTERQECSPKYRKEPVYDEKCHFTVDRWEYARSLVASGKSLTQSPAWPAVQLAKTGTSLGSEREGSRVETYTVQLADPKGETFECDLPQGRWGGIALGSKWSGDTSVLTGTLDCSTLQPAKSK